MNSGSVQITTDIFYSIFKSNKEVLNAFPKLNPNINSSAMKSPKDKAINEAFQEHGTKVEFKWTKCKKKYQRKSLPWHLSALNIEFFQVMARVDEVLHNLDQLNLCVSLIRQTGAYHRRFQGFKPKYFKVFHYYSTNMQIII